MVRSDKYLIETKLQGLHIKTNDGVELRLDMDVRQMCLLVADLAEVVDRIKLIQIFNKLRSEYPSKQILNMSDMELVLLYRGWSVVADSDKDWFMEKVNALYCNPEV